MTRTDRRCFQIKVKIMLLKCHGFVGTTSSTKKKFILQMTKVKNTQLHVDETLDLHEIWAAAFHYSATYLLLSFRLSGLHSLWRRHQPGLLPEESGDLSDGTFNMLGALQRSKGSVVCDGVSQKDPLFQQFVILVSVEGLENKYSLELNRGESELVCLSLW